MNLRESATAARLQTRSAVHHRAQYRPGPSDPDGAVPSCAGACTALAVAILACRCAAIDGAAAPAAAATLAAAAHPARKRYPALHQRGPHQLARGRPSGVFTAFGGSNSQGANALSVDLRNGGTQYGPHLPSFANLLSKALGRGFETHMHADGGSGPSLAGTCTSRFIPPETRVGTVEFLPNIGYIKDDRRAQPYLFSPRRHLGTPPSHDRPPSSHATMAATWCSRPQSARRHCPQGGARRGEAAAAGDEDPRSDGVPGQTSRLSP